MQKIKKKNKSLGIGYHIKGAHRAYIRKTPKSVAKIRETALLGQTSEIFLKLGQRSDLYLSLIRLCIGQINSDIR